MKNKLIIAYLLLLDSHLSANQQQVQKQEEQTQDDRPAASYSWSEQKPAEQTQATQKPATSRIIQKPEPEAPAKVDELANLIKQIEEETQGLIKEHGSVDEAIKNKTGLKDANKEHVRICPTCGGIASQCPADIARIRQGQVLTCGCNICQGLRNF